MAIKPVFGGAALNPAAYPTDESLKELFAVLKEEGVVTIDTARMYQTEERIGRNTTEFTVDTKLIGGFDPQSVGKANAIADADDSLAKLKLKQVDILYLHSPLKEQLEETLEGINEIYKAGKFKRFGLSNFSADQVQQTYDIAKSKGFVLPSVYQGNYNAFARKTETLLLPTLRKLGFSFYAYSPIAGGFLTKTVQQIDEGAGRFNNEAINGLYNKLYNKPSIKAALSEWNAIADQEGVSKAELAYRWTANHSQLKEELGDAIIFGARTQEQARETAQWLRKGKLSEKAAKAIDAIWPTIEKDAPLDNWDVLNPDNKQRRAGARM